MKNNVEVITKENGLFGKVRFAEINGKEYASANDVLKSLGYIESGWRKILSRKCKHVTKCHILTNGGEQEVNFINEGDIYRLIVSSKLPEAEKFESWVFDEVLPEIRRTGEYKTNLKKYEDIIKQQQDMIKHLEICVGLTDKMTKGYSKYIKNRLNILRVNNKYRIVVKNLFDFFAVERWEQIAILDSEMGLKKIDEINDIVNKCIQIGFKL